MISAFYRGAQQAFKRANRLPKFTLTAQIHILNRLIIKEGNQLFSRDFPKDITLQRETKKHYITHKLT